MFAYQLLVVVQVSEGVDNKLARKVEVVAVFLVAWFVDLWTTHCFVHHLFGLFLEEHQVVLGDLVEIVLPQQVAVEDYFAQRVVVHQVFEGVDGNGAFVVESGFADGNEVEILARRLEDVQNLAEYVEVVAPVDLHPVDDIAIFKPLRQPVDERILCPTVQKFQFCGVGVELLCLVFVDTFGSEGQLRERAQLQQSQVVETAHVIVEHLQQLVL